MTARADIIVAGAGPAGATIARLLAQAGRDVVLLHHDRGSAVRIEILPPGAGPLMRALALAPLLDQPEIATPCLGIRRAWGDATTRHEDFLAHPGGTGHAVHRLAFDAALRAMAVRAGVRLLTNARVTNARRDPAGVVVAFADGAGQITARIAIDATGRVAALARRLGACRHRDRPLFARRMAMARTTTPDPWSRAWLSVASTERGWWYGVGGECWFLGDTPRTVPDAAPPFVTATSTLASPLRCVEAGMTRLAPCIGKNWLAIGDAATGFDPLAAQGLWHALASALSASDALAATRRDALVEHAARIGATWEATRCGLADIYAAERRFPTASFWRARA